jgi:hypothetical protein
VRVKLFGLDAIIAFNDASAHHSATA